MTVDKSRVSFENIFERRFLVKARSIDLQTIDDLEIRPFITTGDKTLDRNISRALTDRYMTINDMVEHHRQGFELRVVNRADTETIYRYIEEYLLINIARLKNGMNVGNAPLEDLIALDTFAHAVYDKAKWILPKDTHLSVLARSMSEVTAFAPNKFLGGKVDTSPNAGVQGMDEMGRLRANTPSDTPPDRDSLGSYLEKNLVNLRNWQ